MATKSQILYPEDITRIASIINKNINIPFVSEKKEQVFFEEIVGIINTKLSEIIPESLHSTFRDASDGVSKEELEDLKAILVDKLNERIDIPILSERQEAKLIDTFLDTLLSSMEIDKKLDDLNNILEG